MATAGNDDDEVEGDEEDEEAEEGGDLDTSLKLFMKKANGQKKKKPGRKAKWCPWKLTSYFPATAVIGQRQKTRILLFEWRTLIG